MVQKKKLVQKSGSKNSPKNSPGVQESNGPIHILTLYLTVSVACRLHNRQFIEGKTKDSEVISVALLEGNISERGEVSRFYSVSE